MDLGIVIVNWNVRELLAACLESVYLDLAQSGLSGAVCVVDSGSTDDSAAMVRARFPSAALVESENRGMGAGNNLGLRALGFDRPPRPFAALVLNPDTVIRPGALRTLTDFLRRTPRAGAVAPKLLNADGSLQHSGFHFPGVRQAFFDLFPPQGRLARLIESPFNGRYPARWYASGAPFRAAHTLGAAFLVRGEALTDGPLFDEVFYMYCEEIDAQRRLARKGWETWVAPAAEIMHHGGQSTRQTAAQSFVHLWASRRRLYGRYHGPLVNLLVRELVGLAMRGRIRANHRLSQRGQLSPDRRAELNRACDEVMRVWQRRRARREIVARDG